MQIRSITDVITNSSSETFIVKLNDPIYEKLKLIDDDFVEIPDLDSLKKIILSEDYSSWEDYFGCEFEVTPNYDIFGQWLYDEDGNEYKLEKTEENWEKFKELYRNVVGKAILCIDRDSQAAQDINECFYRRHIEETIQPVIDSLKVGKSYSVKIKGYYSGVEDIIAKFKWEGNKSIEFITNTMKSPAEIDIEVLLNMSKLETLHED